MISAYSLKHYYEITHTTLEETRELYKDTKNEGKDNSCKRWNLVIISFETVLMEPEMYQLITQVAHSKVDMETESTHLR